MPRYKAETFIHAKPQEVRSIINDPRVWTSFYCGVTEVEVLEGTHEVGTTVDLCYRLAGRRLPIRTEVVEDVENADGSCSWRMEFGGQLAGWILWKLEPREGGTQVSSQFQVEAFGLRMRRVAVKEGGFCHQYPLWLEQLKILAENPDWELHG
jgi:carbon monoxide dehydrogenase subunit G